MALLQTSEMIRADIEGHGIQFLSTNNIRREKSMRVAQL
jgi:hypothetical protein